MLIFKLGKKKLALFGVYVHIHVHTGDKEVYTYTVVEIFPSILMAKICPV